MLILLVYYYIYMYWRNSSIPIRVIKTLIVEYMVTIFPLHCNRACGPVTCALQFYPLLSSLSPPSYQYLSYTIILALPPLYLSLTNKVFYMYCTCGSIPCLHVSVLVLSKMAVSTFPISCYNNVPHPILSLSDQC